MGLTIQHSLQLPLGSPKFVALPSARKSQISPKSKVFTGSVWLFIKGFNNNHWLIISANGVDKQSYARLKRAVLSAVNGAQEPK